MGLNETKNERQAAQTTRDIGGKFLGIGIEQSRKGIPTVKAKTPVVEKRAGGVEVITTFKKLLCEFCNEDTGRYIDGQTDSVECQRCHHRLR